MPEARLDFLTEEPVAGELLAERLKNGSLSPEDALRHSIEIGMAIAKAHAAGLVHGAICPSCIALTTSGARLLRPDPSPEARAAYRSPEQVMGEEPDTRSDIWAFGAVAYEMATGRRAFPSSNSEFNQNIVAFSPPAFAAGSPILTALEGVILGCLEKDPVRRRQRMQNAVIELKLMGTTLPPIVQAARRRQLRAAYGLPPTGSFSAAYGRIFSRRFWMIGIAVLALAATSLAAVLILHQRPNTQALTFTLAPPENTSYAAMPAVSPNGKYVTFSAIGADGKRTLWLRTLDDAGRAAPQAANLAGTEGASAPFWSPDSQFIAFFAGKSLKKVRVPGGGTPEVICPSEESAGGGAWNKDGTILFSPGLADGLYKVPFKGGRPEPVLNLDAARFERAALWPQFLPDGRHFVFYLQTDLVENSGVYAGSLDDSTHRRIFTSQTNAVYSPASSGSPKNGYLLFINDRSLTCRPFDAANMQVTGDPIVLASDVGAVTSLSLAPVAVSAGGVLIYQGVGKPTRQLVWMDRGGKLLAAAGPPGEYGPPRISPDGERAIAAKLSEDGVNAHLWMLDASGASSFGDSTLHEGSPVWSPDGSKIAYFSIAKEDDALDIYQRPVAPGGKAELLYKNAARKLPTDWSRDGKYLVFQEEAPGTGLDLWVFSVPEHRAAPLISSIYAEGLGVVSPDGKWLAYQSTQVGNHFEVFVQAFEGLIAGSRKRWLVSSNGGSLPRWSRNGSELCYITGDGRVVSVPIRDNAGELEAGEPQRLFQARPIPGTWNMFDVTSDGQRFIVNQPLEWASAAPITVITNWAEKLKD